MAQSWGASAPPPQPNPNPTAVGSQGRMGGGQSPRSTLVSQGGSAGKGPRPYKNKAHFGAVSHPIKSPKRGQALTPLAAQLWQGREEIPAPPGGC